MIVLYPTLVNGRTYWEVFRLASDRYTPVGLVTADDTLGQALNTLAWLGTNKKP